MKTIRHKPTVSPVQCNSCKQIWYGSFYNVADNPLIPQGQILCHHCLKALGFYLLKKDEQTFSKVWEAHNEQENNQEWKKAYLQFFEMAKQWIGRNASEPNQIEKAYASTVPKWARTAIDLGKMTPNDEYVYTVTTQGDTVVQVEKVIYSEGERYLKRGPIPLKYRLFSPPKRATCP